MKWTNPLKKIKEGYQDDTGFHYGKLPVPRQPEWMPEDDKPQGFDAKALSPMISNHDGFQNVEAVCNYCRETHPLKNGLIIAGLYFHRLHCYLLWDRLQRPVTKRRKKLL